MARPYRVWPRPILERAAQLQIEHGTAYGMPFGTDVYRKAVVEQYWKLDPGLGYGPANVLGTAGGRAVDLEVLLVIRDQG